MTSLDSTNQPNPHVADQIEAYLAGGLTGGERAAFESHVAGCPGCGALLEQIREADSALVELFADARPGDGFEDRLIHGLRKSPASRWRSRLKANPAVRMVLHPTVRRAAFGVAAAVVLAAVGHAAKSALERQTLPGMRHGEQFADIPTDLIHWRDRAREAKAANNLRQIGSTALAYSNGDVQSGSYPRTYFDVSSGRVKGVPLPGEPASPPVLDGSNNVTASYFKILKTQDVTPDVFLSPGPATSTLGVWGAQARNNLYTPDKVVASGDGKPIDLYDAYLLPAQNWTTLGGRAPAPPVGGAAHEIVPPVVTAGTISTNGGQAGTTYTLGPSTNVPGSIGTTSTSLTTATTPPTVAATGLSVPTTTPPNAATGALALSGTNTLATLPPASTPDPGVVSGGNTYSYQTEGRVAGKPVDGLGIANGGTPDANGTVVLGRQFVEGKNRETDVGQTINTAAVADGRAGGSGGAGGGGGAGGPGLFRNMAGAQRAPTGVQEGFKPTALGYLGKPGDGEVNHLEKPGDPAASRSEVVALGNEPGKDVRDLSGKPADFSDAPKFDLASGGESAKGKEGPAGPEAKPQAVALAEGSQPGGSAALETPPPATVAPAPATPATPAIPPPPGDTAVTGPSQPSNPSNSAPAEQGTGAKPQPAPAPAPPAPTPAELQAQAMQRKIIRNGEMFFDVDSYDSSMMLVGKIAAEEGAFIATTDSEKLPNGKVKGSVIVRCPPDRLDTLVLKLRGLGDLKSQRIAAQDITKQYTDLESQLRAAHAMEDRLLEIIKDGKGAIKDLLEAEKQLGVWREKLEGLEGEIRYYNNLISLSTLTITLTERDIKTPYATAQSEQVSMGIVAEEVEKARTDAISQIEAAKGRVLESELKKHEAGQFSATIVADVSPDAADPLIDRLKQIGRVARLDRERKQTSEGGTGAPPPGVKIERQDTRLQLSIYNLADVSPRTSTSMNLAAADVEKSYKSIMDQVKAGGGRIISSQLNRPKADQVTGTITFDVPSEKADVLSAAIRSGVEVMRLDVTDAKKGFVLQIFSLASVAPRETTVLQIASRDVPTAFNKLLDAARTAGGRVSTSQLNEQNVANITGTLDFDVPRDNSAKVDAAIREAGLTVTRNVTRSPDSDSTVDSKVRLQVTLIDEINLTARQSIAQTVAARNVPEAFNKLAEALHNAGARIAASQLNDQDKPTVNAQISFSIQREDAAKADAAIREAGLTVVRSVGRSADLQNTVDTKLTYQVMVIDEISLAARQTIAQTVAARNVAEAFNKLVDTLHDAGARVVTSQLNDQDKPTVNAQINFTIEREAAAKAEAAVHDAGETVVRSVARSADLQNTVDTKVSYQVTMVDQRNLQPRETISELVAVKDVPGRYAKVLDALRLLDAQVYSSQLMEQNKNDVSAVLDFAVRRDPAHAAEVAAVERALGDASDIFSRTAVRSQDVTNTVDTKIRYQVTMRDADTQPPRETYTLDSEVSDVDKALADLEAAGIAAGGRAVDSTPSTGRNEKGEPTGHIVLDVPLARAGDIVNAVRDKGHVTATRRTRDDRVPEGDLSRARIDVTISTGAIMAGEGSVWDPIKSGLRTSATGLLLALQYIIVGLCLIGPIVVALWIIYKIIRWARKPEKAEVTEPPAQPPGPVPAAG